MGERWMTAILEHPRRVIAGVLLLTAVSVAGMLRLDVLTAREALMPADAPVMQRLEQFLERFGAASDLIVVLEGGTDRDRFAAALADRLSGQRAVRSAFDRVPPRTFVERAWLLAPRRALDTAAQGARAPTLVLPDDLAAAFAAATARLEDAPATAPAAVDDVRQGLAATRWLLEEWRRWITSAEAPTTLDWGPLLAPHGAGEIADGRFRSRDGRLSFVFVRPTNASGEFSALDPFIRAVRAEAEALSAAWTDPPTVGLAGLPAVAHEEFAAVQADIQLVIITSSVLILLLVLLWLRSPARAVAIFVPMGLGVVWNLGLAGFWIGHLTIITSSFTAILFGLGVDYGIFLSARVLDAGDPAERRAIITGGGAALRPLLVAGGATTLIFAALATSAFPGFAELGQVAATGVVLVVLATLLVQPLILAAWPPRPRPATMTEATTGAPRRGLAALVVLLGLGGAAAGVAAGPVPFDYDVMALLPADSEAARLQRRMSAESDFQAEVVLLTAPNITAARTLARAVEALPSIARVHSLEALFPDDAADRLASAHLLGQAARHHLSGLEAARPDLPDLDAARGLVGAIRATLEDGQEQAFAAGQRALVTALGDTLEAAEGLDAALKTPQARARTEALAARLLALAREGAAIAATWVDVGPPDPKALPPVLRDRFFAADGAVAVYAWPKHSVYDPQALATLNAQVLAVAPDATGFPITHHQFADLVVGAYRQGTLFAAGAALLWIILVLRRPSGILLAALPLLVGGAWMNGALHLLGQPVNFANIIALPLVMGLAIDYGVWFAHEAAAHPKSSGWAVAARARGPILLAAATTLGGLGAITLARYEGVASMGRSITIGLLACVLAALVLAPAITQLLFRRAR